MAAALTIQTFPSWNDTASELFQNLMPRIYPPQQLALKSNLPVRCLISNKPLLF
jgi:hypothetical protein